MLASGDVVNLDRHHGLMLDNRSLPNTNIVDLVAHLLHPHDEWVEEPKAFSLFVQALKDIKLESEWVQNELVKDLLDDVSDTSDSKDDYQRAIVLLLHHMAIVVVIVVMTLMKLAKKETLTFQHNFDNIM